MTSCPRDAAGYAPREPLPDLLGLSLAELRRLDHPVLSEVLAELRDRLARPGETLWDFDEFAENPTGPGQRGGFRPERARRGVDRGT